ncbi:hypothetical protein KCU64_g5366, partial [Aureobasidium melanogenum]
MSSQTESNASSSKSTTTQSTSIKAVSIPSKIPPGTCFHQNIVTIEVGMEKKVYSIHKDLLVFYSDYFRAAFNGSFTEAAEGKISLPHESANVFDIVVKFVYTRQLSDGVDCDVSWEMLCRVWIFGDKYLMPALQNEVMTALQLKYDKTKAAPTSCLKVIYNNTVSGSLLRKFVVDLAAYTVTGMDEFMKINETEKRWTYDALIDLVKTIGAKKKQDVGIYELPEANRHKCYYHVHADGEKCL